MWGIYFLQVMALLQKEKSKSLKLPEYCLWMLLVRKKEFVG